MRELSALEEMVLRDLQWNDRFCNPSYVSIKFGLSIKDARAAITELSRLGFLIENDIGNYRLVRVEDV